MEIEHYGYDQIADEIADVAGGLRKTAAELESLQLHPIARLILNDHTKLMRLQSRLRTLVRESQRGC